MAISGLFTAQILSNPFYSSFRPGEHTKTGLYRLLPPELTLVNDLPVNVSPSRASSRSAASPPVSAYFLDDNAYNARGRRVLGARRVAGRHHAARADRAGGRARSAGAPLRIAKLEVELESGAVPDRVTIRTGAETQVVEIPAHDRPHDQPRACRPACRTSRFPTCRTTSSYPISIESASPASSRSSAAAGATPASSACSCVWSRTMSRAGLGGASGVATILVATASPPFAEGGHLVMARELVRALHEAGHRPRCW